MICEGIFQDFSTVHEKMSDAEKITNLRLPKWDYGFNLRLPFKTLLYISCTYMFLKYKVFFSLYVMYICVHIPQSINRFCKFVTFHDTPPFTIAKEAKSTFQTLDSD